MKRWWMARIAKLLAFFIISVLVLSFIVVFLWNSLIPALFNGPTITFVQALGLLLLMRILTLGFRPWRYTYTYKGAHWRKKFEEKLAAMPPEQREKIRQLYANKCGGWYASKNSNQESASVNSMN